MESRQRTLLLLVVVAIAPSLGTIAALILWPGPVGGAIYALCKVVLYGVPAVIAWRTLRWSDVSTAASRGFSRSGVVFGLSTGVLVGGIMLGGWWGGLREALDLTRLSEVVTGNGLNERVPYLLAVIWLSLGNSLLEEFVFRWFVDTRLARLGVRGIPIFLISAAIFTAHHILVLGAYFDLAPTIVFSLGVFIGGFAWSWSRSRWESIVPGWISHAMVDGAIFLVGWQMLFG